MNDGSINGERVTEMMNSLRYARIEEIENELKKAKSSEEVQRLLDEKRQLLESIKLSNIIAQHTKGG